MAWTCLVLNVIADDNFSFINLLITSLIIFSFKRGAIGLSQTNNPLLILLFIIKS